MDIIKLRFFNVYGPHQDFKRKQPPFTGYLLKQLMNGEDLNVFSDGEQRRDYVHVVDLAELINIDLSELLRETSKIFSTPLLPISTGTPKYIPLTEYSPFNIAAHGKIFFLSFKYDSHICMAAAARA